MSKALRVLCVEDSEEDSLLLLRELRNGGYDPVWERVDTADAMSVALEEGSWDLVLADFAMPGFSALAALNLIQQARLDLPFIIVSGVIGEEQAVAMMKAGAHDYVFKDNLRRFLPAIERELHDATVRRQRKRAEEALQRSEARLQLQIERMPIGMIVWSLDFRVVSWNPAAQQIFGFTADEALGKHPYGLIVPKGVQPHVDAIYRRLLEGDFTAHSMNENVTKDDRIIICQWSNTPLKETDGGGVIGILSMVQDITERKKADEEIRKLNEGLEHRVRERTAELVAANQELELRSRELSRENTERKQAMQSLEQSEKRYRRLVESSLGFICTHDLEGTLLSINPAAAHALGYEPAELAGRKPIELLEPSVRHFFTSYLKRIREQKSDRGFTRIVAKDGTERIWAYRNVLLEEAEGNPYVLGRAQDITELKRRGGRS